MEALHHMGHPSWDDLRLYQVDLHFHAGTERPECCSALDFISFAVATGRRILGVTDHFGRYLGHSKKKLNHYEGSLEGFGQFSTEVKEAALRHPEAMILLGPEMGCAQLDSRDAGSAFILPEVAFFIGEPPPPAENESYGESLVRGIHSIAEARSRYGRPGLLGHPLRSLVNQIVGKTGPGPMMPLHPFLSPLGSYDDPREHVEEIFDLDIEQVAAASADFDVPIEINGESWRRIMAMNCEPFAERYLFFYRTLLQEGAGVVLGSDLHSIEHPVPTPFVVAEILGVSPQDMAILDCWLGEAGG